MALIAHRGGVSLSDETELRVLLASLLRLENVGVLLGAGASVSAGGSTMKQLWSDFLWNWPRHADWLLGML